MIEDERPQIEFNGVAGSKKGVPEDIVEKTTTDCHGKEKPDKKDERALPYDQGMVNRLHYYPGNGYLDQESHKGACEAKNENALAREEYWPYSSDPALGLVRINRSPRWFVKSPDGQGLKGRRV
jgi:hypothetical protein